MDNNIKSMQNKNGTTPVSPTFCILPWTHLMIQPNGNIQPCCMTPHDMPIGNTSEDTLEEVWNGFVMKNIRKKMFNGEKPMLCNRCYLMEDNGALSPRMNLTQKFASQVDTLIANTDKETGHNNDFVLKYWDFRFSNICNFKCRMCGTFASSKWVDDEMAIHGKANSGLMNFRTESKEEIFNHIDRFINDVEEIYFAGGEPLIMDEHYMILEKLIAAGRTNVLLRYNTNFSHIEFKKWDLRKLWQPFLSDPRGKVQLFASLDAAGDVAELSRHGTKWEEVYNNISKILKTGVEVFVSPTISILNVFHVTDLFDAIVNLGVNPNHIVFNNFLTDPQFYDIRILPEDLKEELVNKLENYVMELPESQYKLAINNAISSWIHFLYSELNVDLLQLQISRRELLRITTILDVRRNENFLEVNPQYKEWFKEIRATVTNYETEEMFFRDRSLPEPSSEIPKTSDNNLI